jgi:Carboxylesterase family
MKKFLLPVMFILGFTSYGQSPCSLWPRYDQEVFSNVTTSINVPFGSNYDYQGVNKDLKMNIYEPAGDTLSQRPLIVFAHGGSFVAGDKSNSDQVDLCTHFAKRGYVTATIDYRLGIFPINAANATDAVYRAVQDMKAAVRFFRKDAVTANAYKIDPNVIFIGGTSAGAFTALHYAYLNTYAELPATIDTADIGDLEGNSGNPGYSSEVNAVINLCGALGDADWVIPGDVPLCSMHGTSDNTVPYSTQTLYLLGLFPIMVVDGSYAIHNHLNSFNHPAAMYTWSGAPHVPYDGGTANAIAYLDTTLRFVSNFLYSYAGCVPSDPNPVANTIYTTTGITQSNAVAGLNVVANPCDQEIILKGMNEEGLINVFDNMGRNVTSKSIRKGSSELVIACGNYPEGFYMVHFQSNKGVDIVRVVVRH